MRATSGGRSQADDETPLTWHASMSLPETTAGLLNLCGSLGPLAQANAIEPQAGGVGPFA